MDYTIGLGYYTIRDNTLQSSRGLAFGRPVAHRVAHLHRRGVVKGLRPRGALNSATHRHRLGFRAQR